MNGAVSGENLADEVDALETALDGASDEVDALEAALDSASMNVLDLKEQLEVAKHDVRAAGFLGFLLGLVTVTLLLVGIT